MKSLWLLALAVSAHAAHTFDCNATGFYAGDTHVLLTAFYSGPPTSALRPACGEQSVEGDTVHRVLLDQAGEPYFGYDLKLTPDRAGRAFRVTVARPHGVFAIPHAHQIDGAKLRTFSKFPAPLTVPDGDRFEIPVLENPATGLRMIDSYAVGLAGTAIAPPPAHAGDAAIAPDGTLLHLEQPSLTHDGNSWGENPTMGVSGPAVWVYIPWRGRFLLSATARPGYRRTGIAFGSKIRFPDGNEAYQIDLQANAIEHPGAWWIWVKREPESKPTAGPWSDRELHHGLLAIGVER